MLFGSDCGERDLLDPVPCKLCRGRGEFLRDLSDSSAGGVVGEGFVRLYYSPCAFLHPPWSLQTMDEIEVAIKTCKPDAPNEDKSKFLQEACKFSLD